MGCTVVCGAFWGDEGKGKIVSYLAVKDHAKVCVRTGSVNAAHTVWVEGKKYALHMVPSAFVYDKCRLMIGAGSNVHVSQFLKEVEATGVEQRISVDPQCSVIEEKHSKKDREDAHLKGIGTTGWGVGPAIEERVRRTAKLARDIPELQPYLANVSGELNKAIEAGSNVLLEGSQGLMLSLFHGAFPYVTGRDTSASAICSEAGVGPTKVDHALVVYKAFATRVGAGPLEGELSKEEAVRRGWFEIAAGTGRERRSAPFNFEIARRAATINGASEAAVTKIDVLYPRCRGATTFGELPGEAKRFITEIEYQLKVPVVLIGTGPGVSDIIDRRKE